MGTGPSVLGRLKHDNQGTPPSLADMQDPFRSTEQTGNLHVMIISMHDRLDDSASVVHDYLAGTLQGRSLSDW